MIKSIGNAVIYMNRTGIGLVTLSESDFTPGKIYVLKYVHCRIGADTLQRISEELRKVVELKKCSVIAIPDTTDISEFSLDELTKLRDELTETIKNMSYDNIIGF